MGWPEKRPVRACGNCGEMREIAAHGLCFRCYRREEREQEHDGTGWIKPDRHAREIVKAQRKSREALMKILGALDDLQSAGLVAEDIIDAVRRLIRPDVAQIALSLDTSPMNSEQSQECERSPD